MRRHELNVVPLLAGILFAGAGLSALLAHSPAVGVDWQWLWPPVLIGAGVAGLLASRPNSEVEPGTGDADEAIPPLR
jgi:hypothetical protein